ncbi:DUF2207 domain-containing protein [Microbacterium luticocti]|uniref:DUF2207 domain-containing protein n=1 Tax=Microbacterium luticocti TaxID=451764 RepID=UPI0005618074|nr:DUF2207 domain-containing protein [Microbacterium luticocti]
MSRIVRTLVLAAVAVASVLTAVPAAAAVETAPVRHAVGVVGAGVDDFSFRSMHADYTIGREKDGTSTLRVVETFVAVFPGSDQNHGMRRSIPDSYNGQPLDPHLVSVTDGQGHPRAAEVDDDDGAFTITSRADGFVHGEQTYVFTYTLRHVTWTFGDTDADEFYWDVNGVDWAQRFDDVSATLHVPAELAASMTGGQACYAGRQGVAVRCEISTQPGADGAVRVEASAGALSPGETMTIAVGFRQGTFVPFDASFLASPWGWSQGVAGLGVLGAIVWAVVVRVRRLRDVPGRPTIVAEYTPPAELDALRAAVLLGKVDKAIPAEVLEQAVAGSIRIVEGKRRRFGGVQLIAKLVDPERADEDGRMLLRGLFGKKLTPGTRFEFGRDSTRFAKEGQRILRWAKASLNKIGVYRRVPKRVRRVPIWLSFGFFALTVAFGCVALAANVHPAVPAVLMAVGAAGCVVTLMLCVRRPLTGRGAELRDHLKGLELFIDWAEADRIRMLQSPSGAERVPVDTGNHEQMLKLYEALLPYAVVFGQEKKWAAQLASMYPEGTTPYWYSGTHGFSAAAFAAGIGSLSAAAVSSSSTSGGSSGGGFAGGGGGGGGGGGV